MEDKEKVENKNSCGGEMKNCPHCMTGQHCMMGMNNMGGGCFHHCMKRRCLIKKIIFIILIIIAFNIGAKWGEMKALIRGGHNLERGEMMNWGFNQMQDEQGVAKPDVSDTSKAPVTPTAPVKAQ